MTPHQSLMQRRRPRGIYVPVNEAQSLIELCGWEVLDDCPGHDECLLRPPIESSEVAA